MRKSKYHHHQSRIFQLGTIFENESASPHRVTFRSPSEHECQKNHGESIIEKGVDQLVYHSGNSVVPGYGYAAGMDL